MMYSNAENDHTIIGQQLAVQEEEEKLIVIEPRRIEITDIVQSISVEKPVVEEQLGSELSGCSVEVPDEVISFEKSANYLTTYERDYKSRVLVSRNRAQPPIGRRFPSEGRVKSVNK